MHLPQLPAETEPHDRVWLGFPPAGSSAASGEICSVEESQRAWCAVANALVPFVPVTVLANPGDRATARDLLDPRVSVFDAELDDAWLRDTGPTFAHGIDGGLIAIDWVFNGWGAQRWARWDRDARLASRVAALANTPVLPSTLVNEGGGIVTDGAGTVVVTETVQRDPARNPGWSRADVEAELARTVGARHTIWLPRGLTRDSAEFGTRGHADLLVAFPDPDTVLIHAQRARAHPDHAIGAEIGEIFAAERTRSGRPWRTIDLPAPTLLRDSEGFVDYSYLNHLPTNGAVIVGVFDDPTDAEALAVLAAVYPGRRIVPVDARPLFAGGGGVHCITQHQPRANRPASTEAATAGGAG